MSKFRKGARIFLQLNSFRTEILLFGIIIKFTVRGILAHAAARGYLRSL